MRVPRSVRVRLAHFVVPVLLTTGFALLPTLPAAATSTATTFASGFYTSGSIGPIGIAFDASNNLWVTDYPQGQLFKFDPAGAGTFVGDNLGSRAAGLAFTGDGRLYLARQGIGDVIQVSTADASVVRTVVAGLPNPTGLATDPVSGDLFLSLAGGGPHVYRISNLNGAPTLTNFASIDVDGITFAPDGTLYASGGGGIWKITGVTSSNPGSVTAIVNDGAPYDGIALASSITGHASFLYANRNDGIITKVDLTTSPPTVSNIITGGSRGDFAAVGSDGCLYATQTSSVIKVTDSAGACNPPLAPSTPSGGPSTVSYTGGGSASVLPPYPCQILAPVNCLTGEFWHRFTDLSIKGRGPGLLLTRTYSTTLAAQDGPLGFGWTHSYNMALTFGGGGSVTVQEEGGSSITFLPDGAGGYMARGWVVATLTKNADGTYTLRRRNQTTFTFDALGRLISESDRNAHPTTLSYAGGLLAAVSETGGRQFQFQYSGSHLLKVVDRIGRSVSFQYDASGNLVQATDAKGGVTQFTYDANHLLLTLTDPNGGRLSNRYDAAGRVIMQTDPMQRSTTWSYGAGTTTIADAKGNMVQDTYQNGRLVKLTKGYNTAQAATSTMTYDPTTFALTSMTDANGHLTTYSPDAHGNVLKVADPVGRTATFAYNGSNDLTSASDPLGATTRLGYDGNGDVTSVTTPVSTSAQATTGFSYDPANPGDVVAVTDADGQVWRFTHDAYGNINKTVDPLGDATSFTYDLGGRLTVATNARGNTTTYGYDAFNNLLTLTDSLGHTTTYQYDGNENPIATTDPNGHTVTATYDLDNEPVQETRADGSQLRNSFDAAGNLAGQVDGLGNATGYAYDSLNRLVSVTDPLGHVTAVGFDAAGNRTSVTDGMGRKSTFTYDAANELTTIAYSDGKTPNVSLTYDADGRRTGMSDGSGASSYSYDQSGRVIVSTNGSRSVRYGYDLGGHLTTLTYPDGSQVLRTYDAAGRLATVADWVGHQTAFGYDADGNPSSQLNPNGTRETIAYDAADRLTSIAYSGPMGQITFTEGRNNLGQVTAENVVGEPPNGPVSYAYDPVNRITSANYAVAALSYGHDAADRLTQITASSSAGSVVSSLAYDAASELTSLTRTQGSQIVQKLQYSYDNNGNRTQTVDQTGAITSFTYDQANRMVDYAGKDQYTYNGDGLRMAKTVGGVAAPFTWDMSGRLPLLIQDGTTRYVTGLDGLPLEQISSDGTIRYYHQDALGSTRALTNGQGQLDSVYAYDPYGSVATFTGSKTPNPFQFAGQYTDAESGLQYLRSRYYEPRTGQFTSRDPLVAATRQAYAYAQHDPVNRVDRNGLYDYQYDEYIGKVSDVGGAAAVMSFLQQNLAAMFPFSTGSCTQVVLGAQCVLQPVPFNLIPSEVTVTSVTATSFTFTSGAGHVAGPGGTITFSTYVSGGAVYLRETAHAPNASWWENIVDPPGAWLNWQQLASNLSQALTPPACPPNIIPVLPLPFL